MPPPQYSRILERLQTWLAHSLVWLCAIAVIVLGTFPEGVMTEGKIRKAFVVLMPIVAAFLISKALLSAGKISSISSELEELRGEVAKERVVGDLDERVAHLSRSVESVLRNTQGKLLGLTDCVRDLEGYLQTAETVEIDWLGIDLGQSSNLTKSMFERFPAARFRFRVLMIAGKWPEKPSWLPENVKRWSEMAAVSQRRLEDFLRNEVPALARQSKEIDLQFRAYARVPWIHGFHMKAPQKIWYLSFCRWDGKDPANYEFKPDAYHRIEGPVLAQSLEDLTELFDHEFEHLWANSEKLGTARVPPEPLPR